MYNLDAFTGILTLGNTSGTIMASTAYAAGSSFYHNGGFALFGANGVYVNNTFYDIYNTGAIIQAPVLNSDRWSGDGQVAYVCTNYRGTGSVILSTWSPVGNTWTTRVTQSAQATSISQTAQPFIYRLPLGNTGSVWAGATITSTRSTNDVNARQPRIATITPANDGNVFLIGSSPNSNTATATSTFGTAITTVASSVPYSPPQIFRFQDTNGTFSNYGAVTGTAVTGESRQFGTDNSWDSITSAKIPGSNNSIRVMTIANFPNLTINGVAAANLNTANAIYIPLRFDINSSNVISNFRGQLPVIVPISSAEPLSAGLSFGPSNLTNSVGVIDNVFRAIKTANV
jgi:hypothetical protein